MVLGRERRMVVVEASRWIWIEGRRGFAMFGDGPGRGNQRAFALLLKCVVAICSLSKRAELRSGTEWAH